MAKRLPPFEIGTRFGDWTVIAQIESAVGGKRNAVSMFSLVRCSCGLEKQLKNNYLRAGRSNGCGCRRSDALSRGSTRHGRSYSATYSLWKSIKYRLKRQLRYAGIKMHEPWVEDFEKFEAFIETLGPKPTPEHTLDRIESRGHYEPGNLRWADKSEQALNRRDTGNFRTRHDGRKWHGKSQTPAYRWWQHIKYRLTNDVSYAGIKMHEPWVQDFEAFEAFIETLGPKPTPEHTLDRIESRGHYEPGNLRWADKKLQSENRRNAMVRNLETMSIVKVGEKHDLLTVLELLVERRHGQNWYMARVRCDCGTEKTVYQKQLLSTKTKSCGCFKNRNLKLAHKALEKPITVGDETHSMAGWARKLGVSSEVIWNRINKLGWEPARAVSEPLAAVETVTIDGVTKTVADWCRESGISYSVAYNRIHKRGWDPARAIQRSPRKFQYVVIDGKSLADCCKETGVPYGAAYQRISRGWDPKKAVTEPPSRRKTNAAGPS